MRCIIHKFRACTKFKGKFELIAARMRVRAKQYCEMKGQIFINEEIIVTIYTKQKYMTAIKMKYLEEFESDSSCDFVFSCRYAHKSKDII